MRVVVVDLLCNSPYYCGPFTAALRDANAAAELASPAFYLDETFLDPYPRAAWIRDLTVHFWRPRPLRLASRAIEGLLNFGRLLTRVGRGRYDVVHVQWIPIEGRTPWFMRLLRNRCDATGTLLVYSAHNVVPHDRPAENTEGMKRNLDLAHLIVAHTDHVRQDILALGTSSPVVVIPHGPLFVDHPLPDRSAAAARLNNPPGPVVLFVGLLRPYKGLDLLADSWFAVKASFPDARLIVAGRRADPAVGPDLARLQGLSGVEVIDRYLAVDEMIDYYAIADVVVIPYRRISQSGVLMTAVGLGRPVVMTPLAGLREQSRGMESVITASEISGPALSHAIIEGLERSVSLGEAATRDRARLAASPAGWSTVGRSTVDAYHGAIAGRSVLD